ncbi:Bifunctional ligase/repressor BirA [Stieleria neptunia]|uniref:biotin--[biotin carboxyl-carrier protein] ligase n=1 Tax=Stieleria neptunia TaxID=2527979 RepID=A0A518HK29_9BACT|nr:biotin--[acetyl-CoA-carboxylase] ligase [Stieleria neptunia]QDV41205.1 Bifunctional ligase/repressor BirA [Stieleria neptunia]
MNCDDGVTPSLRHTLDQLIRNGVIASAVYRRATASTNSDALAELQTDRIDDRLLPRLVLADRQTAGRGRHGNAWISEDDALTFSLVIPFELTHPSASVLSPAVGVAVARAIEFSCPPCRVALKWPNDICTLRSSDSATPPRLHKLGGILIETNATIGGRMVVGVGLNLNGKPQLDSPHSTPPASIAELTDRHVSRESMLAANAESLAEMLGELDEGPDEWIGPYRSRCALAGHDLSLKQSRETITGHCTGITDDGSLELIVDGNRRHFRSGEVQRVRPA